MHPSFHEHLAHQRIDELLREAHTRRLLNHVDHQTLLSSIKPLLLYLLAGSPLQSGRLIGDIYHEQAQVNSALRMTGLVALALGVLAGSLLANRFGLAPAALLDSAVLLAMLALVTTRSIRLITTRKLPEKGADHAS
jgi:hypothetical protein